MKEINKGDLWLTLFVAALTGSSDLDEEPRDITAAAAQIAYFGVVEVQKRYPNSVLDDH